MSETTSTTPQLDESAAAEAGKPVEAPAATEQQAPVKSEEPAGAGESAPATETPAPAGDSVTPAVKTEDATDKESTQCAMPSSTSLTTTTTKPTTTSTTEAPANKQADKADEPTAASDKVEDMVTDKIEADPVAKAADESVEVKMETSITETKSDKPVTGDAPTNAADNNINNLATNNQQQANENKEPAAVESKPSAPTSNDQPLNQTENTLPTRQYLDSTVVPILHSALSQLAKIRPVDPIQFLCNYLSEFKDSYTQDSK